MEQQLNDIVSRLRRLEAQKSPRTQNETVNISGNKKVFFDEPITLKQGTATADVDWTDSGSRQHIPENATEAIIWAGTINNCNGTGLNYIRVRGGGVTRIVCEQRGTSTGDTQNNIHESTVPLSNGRFDFSIDLDGANNFQYRIDLIGYSI